MKTVRERLWTIRWPLLACLITAAGLALRVWSAWWNRYSPNGDFGIIALMAKHMAEGTDYPAFAYGTGYMGGLEPILAALLGKLSPSGVSAFTVHLSTALLGTLLLPLLYVFARDAGSRRAGVMAMLYCLVGSDTNFHYATEPRGGYMNMVAGGLLTLWLACRITTRLHRGEAVAWRTYLWMGLAAGTAWWVTPLSVVFLATACLVFLLGFRWHLISRGLWPSVLGFLLGGLPWWIWNFTHQWGTFDFGSSLGRLPFALGFEHFRDLFLRVVAMAPAKYRMDVARLALLLGLLGGFVALLARDRIRRANSHQFYYRLALPLLTVVMVLAFCTSSYAATRASRYLLPIVPALAIMAGVTGDWLCARFRFPWGWLLLLAVVPTHVLLLPRLPDAVKESQRKWALAAQLEREAGPLCDGTFLGDFYSLHWINFASRERLCVASLPNERYAPYARRAELSERRGYLNNYYGIQSFLRNTMASGRRMTVGDITVDYAVAPPSDDWRYVEPADIASAKDQTGTDCRAVLTDGGADTSWRPDIGPASTGRVTVVFNRSVPLCGIRLLSVRGEYPHRVSVWGRSGTNVPWRPLLPVSKGAEYFWSGPYAMLSGMQFYQEFRFAAPDGGVNEIRVTFAPWDETANPLTISELVFLEQGPAPAAARPDAAGCSALLRERGIRRFYAPRWLAVRMALSSPELVTRIPSLFSRAISDPSDTDPSLPHPVVIRESTGLLMDARDVPRSRVVLRECGLRWQETPAGSLVLLTVAPDPSSDADPRCSRFYWTELGCFGADNSKARAQAVFSAAAAARGVGGASAELAALREAVRLYPRHQPARQRLIAALNAAGLNGEAATNAAALNATTQPEFAADIRFKGGARFFGLNVVPRSVRRGETLTLTYFWKCSPSLDRTALAAFVHLVRDGHRFQDDHLLLDDQLEENLCYQPFEEVFTETRCVTVPESAPAGEHKILLGLYDKHTGLRWPLRTELPHRKKAVELPVTVQVLP